MSKALGTKKAKIDARPTADFVNFMNKYDTLGVDATLGNLTNYAQEASQNLGEKFGGFNIDASDEARRSAEQATYQAYVDRLNPQFERQTDDMQTRLANQGLSVGSEAYQRAMSDMLEKQNEAYNQAGYQSVLAGQDAYSRDLQNDIAAQGAQQSYINQLLSALQGSASGYEKAQDVYAARQGLAAAKQQAQQQANANRMGLVNGLMQAGGMAAGMALASDKRLKENLHKIAEVDGFNIYSFNYIGKDTREVGVIAQEMLEKCPECVIHNYKNSGFYGVDYSKLPTKVQSRIKELK